MPLTLRQPRSRLDGEKLYLVPVTGSDSDWYAVEVQLA
jgi:hypothetical protein